MAGLGGRERGADIEKIERYGWRDTSERKRDEHVEKADAWAHEAGVHVEFALMEQQHGELPLLQVNEHIVFILTCTKNNNW